jgi:hypothetical protein
VITINRKSKDGQYNGQLKTNTKKNISSTIHYTETMRMNSGTPD